MSEPTKADLERAKDWLESYLVSIPSFANGVQALAREFAAVRDEERERCAKVAYDYGDRTNKDQWTITHTMAGVRIASAIRGETNAE